MSFEISYTVEEVAKLLKVSKLTVYDLIKKGELPVFRVGRQMRMSAQDLEAYMKNAAQKEAGMNRKLVIGGQDILLDMLSKNIEKNTGYKVLRSHKGSLDSLIAMYNGECDIVSLHMYDGDTGEYNVPYVKKILVGYSYILINLVARKAGLYVQKGNPHRIAGWEDLQESHLRLVNREKGSGARILLDEQLRIHDIPAKSIKGYEKEEMNHISVATAVAGGHADVGVGIEKAAKLVGVDFIPLMEERYDLLILKTAENEQLIENVIGILNQPAFLGEIEALGDYNCALTGKVMYETF